MLPVVQQHCPINDCHLKVCDYALPVLINPCWVHTHEKTIRKCQLPCQPNVFYVCSVLIAHLLSPFPGTIDSFLCLQSYFSYAWKTYLTPPAAAPMCADTAKTREVLLL